MGAFPHVFKRHTVICFFSRRKNRAEHVQLDAEQGGEKGDIVMVVDCKKICSYWSLCPLLVKLHLF